MPRPHRTLSSSSCRQAATQGSTACPRASRSSRAASAGSADIWTLPHSSNCTTWRHSCTTSREARLQRLLRQLIGQAVDEGQQMLEGCHFLLICAQPVPTNILDRSNLTRVADQNHHIDRIRIRFQGILKPVRDPDPTVHNIKEVAKYLFFLKM